MTNEELFALLKKNPISVGCAVLSLALGAGIYFRGDLVPAATETLAKKSEEGARLAVNLKNAAQLKEQVDTLTTAEKELDARLIHALQQLTNYQFFYKLVSDTGVKMTGLSQGVVTPPKGGAKTIYYGVPFTVTILGSMNQVIDYLHRLENGTRYCRVMSVTSSVPLADRASPISVSLNLELLGQP